MGSYQSTDSVVAEAKEAINNDPDRRISLRFPGFKVDDEEFLRNQKEFNDLFDQLPTVLDKMTSLMGLQGGAGKVLELFKSRICKSADYRLDYTLLDIYIEKALLELKVEKMIVQSAHSFIKAEMASIERQLRLYDDPQLPKEQKKSHLAIADNSCYQLLVKFCDPDFYLRKYPLVFGPFLVNFVAVYVPIAQANVRLTSTEQRQADTRKNMTDLRDLVVYFRDESIRERLKHISKGFTDTYGMDPPPLIYRHFLFDTYRNENIKHKSIYTLKECYGEAFEIIYQWHREQAKSVFENYFIKALGSIEQFL